MGGKLFTDKLVLRWLEVLDVWSLDSATHNILLDTRKTRLDSSFWG